MQILTSFSPFIIYGAWLAGRAVPVLRAGRGCAGAGVLGRALRVGAGGAGVRAWVCRACQAGQGGMGPL